MRLKNEKKIIMGTIAIIHTNNKPIMDEDFEMLEKKINKREKKRERKNLFIPLACKIEAMNSASSHLKLWWEPSKLCAFVFAPHLYSFGKVLLTFHVRFKKKIIIRKKL